MDFDPYLLYTVHPEGVKENCLDFKPDPKVQDEVFWSPIVYSWYDGNLIANRPSRLTPEQQIEILNNHPFLQLFVQNIAIAMPDTRLSIGTVPLVGGWMIQFNF